MSTVEETAKIVDAYIAKRADRLAADKVATRLAEEESALKKQLIAIAIASNTRSLGGSTGTVNHRLKHKPTVTDWNALYGYIKEFDAWELLQKRIGEKAVEERWEDEITIPGVSTFPVDELTITGKT